eukprot:4465951-Prymnesium_polylepis.2
MQERLGVVEGPPYARDERGFAYFRGIQPLYHGLERRRRRRLEAGEYARILQVDQLDGQRPIATRYLDRPFAPEDVDLGALAHHSPHRLGLISHDRVTDEDQTLIAKLSHGVAECVSWLHGPTHVRQSVRFPRVPRRAMEAARICAV